MRPSLPCLIVALAGTAPAIACICTGIDGLRFSCEQAEACAPGYDCVDGICQPASTDAGCPSDREDCLDGADNDCDDLADCADPDCNGVACGPSGRLCGGGACICSGNGGPRQVSETSCNDGFDNDCNGLVDCNDPGCRALLCACPEINCQDGVDNDCDGYADCEDVRCLHRQCSTTAASVCCGTGTPGSAFCKNLGTDPANCGGCGTVCPSGSCQPYLATSGRCECRTATCPLGQRCQPPSYLCQCQSNPECASGQTCLDPYCSY